MPACLLKNPVLLELFENVKYDYQTNDMSNSDFKYHRLYNEYYMITITLDKSTRK